MLAALFACTQGSRVAGLALGGAVAAFFAPALLPGRLLLFRDLFFFHYPLRRMWVEALRRGDLPLLNVALNGGQPLLANPNYAVLYPGNILYLVLPFDLAWDLSLAGHALWGGLGMYLLARGLGCRVSAALLGAFSLALCGPMLSAVTYYNLLVAASWGPWVAETARRARDGRRGAALACAGALAAMALAGEPTILLASSILLVTGWFLAKPVQPQRRGAWAVAGIAALAIGLALVQLLPAALWLPHTQRGQGLDFRLSAAYWSLHPERVAELVVPHVNGNAMGEHSGEFWGERCSDGGYPYIIKLYCGVLPLLLVPFAWRRRCGRLAIAGAAAAALFACGRYLPGYEWLYSHLPPLRMVRYPEKLMLVVAFGLAVAAAVGLEALLRGERRRRLAVVAVTLAAAVLVCAAMAPDDLGKEAVAGRRRAIRDAGLALAAAVAAVAVAARGGGRLAAILPLFAFFDLAAVTWGIPRAYPVELVRATPRLLARMPGLAREGLLHAGEQQTGLYFTAGADPFTRVRDALHPFTGLPWGIVYPATNDVDRMSWLPSAERGQRAWRALAEGSSLEPLRQAGAGWVVSLLPLRHPQLVEVLAAEPPAGARVYRIRGGAAAVPGTPGTPAAPGHWIDGGARLHIDTSAIRGAPGAAAVVIHRNALPGFASVPATSLLAPAAEGWIRVRGPRDGGRITLRYAPPGLAIGMLVSLLAAGATLASALRRPARY